MKLCEALREDEQYSISKEIHSLYNKKRLQVLKQDKKNANLKEEDLEAEPIDPELWDPIENKLVQKYKTDIKSPLFLTFERAVKMGKPWIDSKCGEIHSEYVQRLLAFANSNQDKEAKKKCEEEIVLLKKLYPKEEFGMEQWMLIQEADPFFDQTILFSQIHEFVHYNPTHGISLILFAIQFSKNQSLEVQFTAFLSSSQL